MVLQNILTGATKFWKAHESSQTSRVSVGVTATAIAMISVDFYEVNFKNLRNACEACKICCALQQVLRGDACALIFLVRLVPPLETSAYQFIHNTRITRGYKWSTIG
jgi:hypothetical protein